MATSITIEFKVNDLTASYEILGSSKNYSFQENLGRGSDLVDDVGDTFITNIPLKNNYGIFEIRVFSVSEIGVKSNALFGSVEVLPKSLDETFTFSNIKVSSNEYGDLDTSISYSPSYIGDRLYVKSNFAGKSIKCNWSLIPPPGHILEGSEVSTSLLSDTFFSGFKINIKNDGELIDLDQAGFSPESLDLLSQQIHSEKSDISDLLNNYKNFSIDIGKEVFSDLDLSRNVELEIISVDKFGRTATGVLQAYNPEPVLSNLNYSFEGSSVSFSWLSQDIDFRDIKIDTLAIKRGTALPFDFDLQASAEYLKSIREAKPYGEYAGSKFYTNDKVVYNGKIFNALLDHERQSEDTPETSDSWEYIGEPVDFNFFSSSASQVDQEFDKLIQRNNYTNFRDRKEVRVLSVDQLWGYEYYYSFQPIDDFGEGEVYNLTENGLVKKLSNDSELMPLLVDVRIGNLRYRELNDDLVFNWDVVDQDGNLVDINQYKFIFGGGDVPTVLGLSGSLYDIHTEQKLSGITEGLNSKTLSYDEDGELNLYTNLPSTKVFDQYKYTREINNQIYGIGGFPSDYVNYDSSINFNPGDSVALDFTLYKCYSETLAESNIRPRYEKWNKAKNYSINDCFQYKGHVFKAVQSFGPNAGAIKGLFSFNGQYQQDDIVISPDGHVSAYGEDELYNVGDVVFYEGGLYECLRYIPVEEIYYPSDQTSWRRIDPFQDISSSYYRAKQNNPSDFPFSSSQWSVVSPEELPEYFQIIVPSYGLNINNWNQQYKYLRNDLVLYANKIWSAQENNINNVPEEQSQSWSHYEVGETIYSENDLVFSNNVVYKCIKDDPRGGPLLAEVDANDAVSSTYEESDWVPFWELDRRYEDIVFGHVGIPQGGKRSVGLELGILDTNGEIIDVARIGADNPPPFIMNDLSVDSTSEATKVKFNFNYALSFQEKTSKVYLYRSSDPDDFEIIDENGFPIVGSPPFVKSVVGPGDSTFGDNITQIIDNPPIPNVDGFDRITGHYYKILPFDDFGSGVIYSCKNNASPLEKILAYPSRYNNPNPDAVPGRVVRWDPTQAAGAVPGPISGLDGTTAFENFFLNWKAPNSEYDENSTNLIKKYQHDIDHYEVWASDEQVLYTGESKDSKKYWDQDLNTGYRLIDGYFYSVGEIPYENEDPASGIIGAENIFNISASYAIEETVYHGKAGETKNFWVRAVDFAGNKSPFTGIEIGDEGGISGLSLSLRGIDNTDIDGFEIGITEKFGNSVALVPSDPFSSDISNSSISWVQHVLYHRGTGYVINAGSTISGYVWWDKDDATLGDYKYESLSNIRYSGSYKVSNGHPQGGNNSEDEYRVGHPEYSDEDFIISRNVKGTSYLANLSIPNALIGTANIANAAIDKAKIKNLAVDDAKIASLSAGKITAGKIDSADIEIGKQDDSAGVIRTEGFPENQQAGFYLSGDGSFMFSGDQNQGSLSLDEGMLTLKGSLKQVDGRDYDFIEINTVPAHFNYKQDTDYENDVPGVDTFIPSDNTADQIDLTITYRNSTIQANEVRFRMQAISGTNSTTIFGYEDRDDIGGYSKSGFFYNANGSNFEDATNLNPTRTATAKFNLGSRRRTDAGNREYVEGFDQIIDEAFPGGGLADVVVIYASGVNSSYEKAVTIARINDGTIGYEGKDGASVNIIFVRTDDIRGPATPGPSDGNNMPDAIDKDGNDLNGQGLKWYESAPDGNGRLWASKGSTEVGSQTFSWKAPFKIDSPAVAEIYLYRKHNDDPQIHNTFNPSESEQTSNVPTFDFTASKINLNSAETSVYSWSIYPPTLQENQDKIYVCVGLATGSAGDTSAPIQWGDPAVFSQRIDGGQGDPGNAGSSPTYRGLYDPSKSYYFISDPDQPGRGDVVLFTLDTNNDGIQNYERYFICKKTHGPGTAETSPRPPASVAPGGSITIDTNHWADFGAEFESVATDILLADTAYITNQLVVGGSSSSSLMSGSIVSPQNFKGSFNDVGAILKDVNGNPSPNYDPAGFQLSRTSNGGVVFDIGAQEEYKYNDTEYIQESYFRFSSALNRIEFKAALESRTIGIDVLRSETLLDNGSNYLPEATFIGGGYNNKIENSQNQEGGVDMNSLASSIVAGGNNLLLGRFSLIGCGHGNVCKDNFSAIVAGYNNTMPLDNALNEGANFIGAGQNNTIEGGTNQAIICGSSNSIIN